MLLFYFVRIFVVHILISFLLGSRKIPPLYPGFKCLCLTNLEAEQPDAFPESETFDGKCQKCYSGYDKKCGQTRHVIELKHKGRS